MYENYRALAAKARAHCLNMVYIGQSGHIGSMLSAADILAVLYEGTTLDWLGETTDDGWLLVDDNGRRGWVSGKYGRLE